VLTMSPKIVDRVITCHIRVGVLTHINHGHIYIEEVSVLHKCREWITCKGYSLMITVDTVFETERRLDNFNPFLNEYLLIRVKLIYNYL
jgi:hypothetical protein